jgi:DNA-binding response OmpR family regulator
MQGLPTILVVEDDQLIQSVVEEALTEAGFETEKRHDDEVGRSGCGKADIIVRCRGARSSPARTGLRRTSEALVSGRRGTAKAGTDG